MKMNLIKRIFTSLFIIVFATTNSFAVSNCDNARYRKAHPQLCESTNDTFLAILGGAALVGVGAALAVQSNGNHGSSSQISNQTNFQRVPLSANVPINYAPMDYVKNQKINAVYTKSLTNGADIDESTIKSIKSQYEYQRNYKQYDSIDFAYAIGRNFTGKNTSITILDDFYSNHGDTVYEIFNNIAPDTRITNQNIAISADNMGSFNNIANAIESSVPTNIYNASWQIPSIPTTNAAAAIYNSNASPKTYTDAQSYMYNITSENFITQIRNSAADNDAIFVWAAGNESQNESGALSALPLAFPDLNGHFVNVVAIDNHGDLAWYSNQCGITQNYCIAAPGSDWNTDTQSHAYGTSFATPVVSGAIAIIHEAFPYMTASQITALLFTTATDLGETGVDSVYGWGLLNMERATQPVGTPKIVLSNNTIQPLSLSNVSATIATPLKSANIKIAFVDDFNRHFITNLSDNINVVPHGRGFDKLRESENDSVILFDNFEFGFKQNHLFESNGLISTKQNQMTQFVGYKNEFKIDNLNFYQNIRFGITRPQTEENSLITNFSNIYTSSAKIGAQYQDLSFEVAIPDTIISGDIFLTVPVNKTKNGEIVYNTYDINLATKPSIEYTVKYNALSATFVKNHDQENEFFIMAKTKYAF